ncbi:hypothetical protein VKI21_06850 [Cyanobacterium aponinum UTEX 3222]|uniref:hypothetical protein n=1 Tax=Cyanobacterium aponinum TaxID=379064 RepID=UPI002B4BD0DA|nr:hypothetical protein [Cyanobacterium aponinum]WRL37060.1 hypothetical protein VKI22_10500 [Cyanobacterium aponinum UTEX 3221]WRL43395.1 hypothetical protein VKI21_06850 [Cyanobacterium aponinum UTEX 3222]
MADIPSKASRRWEDFKFIYTQDDGQNIVTSDRLSKDENGDYLLPPTALLQARQINDKKTKFWGKPENLRKLEITYEESRNQDGKAETRRYCPYRPTDKQIVDYVKEVISACEQRFGASGTGYCVDYRGENRFTIDRPQKFSEIN